MAGDGAGPDPGAVLARFSSATAAWFEGAFAAPTPAQVGAWDAVSSGRHALVVAPTGSGKTLAAFLWALDGLLRSPTRPEPVSTRVLYVSPLKALGVDVERNLRAPLIGITQTARRLGVAAPDIRVGVRSGDTPPQERRRLVSDPPDILITTPESLYLMLTSQARSALAGVQTVIVDEVHAVAGTKRGAHLAVSLERLDALLDRPAQRIGLSATVEPHEEVARFLGGVQPVQVVAPPADKSWELTVTVPVPDLTQLPASETAAGETRPGLQPHASIWPHVEERIVDLVAAHRSTIVFANSRRIAERLTGRLNEIWAERAGESDDEVDFARAHHGSVSKEQRALVEEALKTGRLRCVVATSSLELGIDMGAVDLVVQVESPPSVASGLQRVGRAGHQVGETSTGWFFPKHRGDLVTSTVVVERMKAGLIESLSVPANPLDVLAQQTVAACALDQLDVEEWFDTVRRSAPFATLPHGAYESVLDLLAGRYPSDEFAELRPRVVWDREAGLLAGRPGAQRLAVTSGGTIPDRGLFGVFLAGSESSAAAGARAGGRRVGELDEEMVYESRVGDVITLGATSWQIQEITHDRVLVVPAFGLPGRVPFWRGDAEGRPVQLGAAVGAFRRELAGRAGSHGAQRLAAAGLDDWARDNLLAYLAEQQQATGAVPTDRTLVVERFRDELGDWRVVLHSPYGLPVHAPWALAVGARLQARFGMDGQAMAADDGIVLRVPMMEDEPPGADLFLFEADELEELVTREVGGSALFAARFRENAARALLLPRRDPGRRSPLWQQRQRSAQLLEVARKYPRFPIVLETVRECLQDVYDLPALKDLADRIAARTVTVVETTTATASPFAQSLLFGYVAQFLYEGDSPLAERRAAALSLDPALLNDLLGRAELRDLLDPGVIASVEADLQRLSEQRRVRGAEGLADALRLLGPLTADQAAARLEPADPAGADHGAMARELLGDLVRDRRALQLRIGGEDRYAAVEDAARLRDALGVALPMGVPLAFLEPVPDPLGDVVARFARTHGPFTAAEAGQELGLGGAVVLQVLQRLGAEHRVTEGEFRPGGPRTGRSVPLETEWCDVEVLRRIRRRSLAVLRAEVEPVEQPAYARFLADWQHLAGPAGGGSPATLEGVDGVAAVLEQLAGVAVPASAWETHVLPSRVKDYAPSQLDELLAGGEFVWSGTAAGTGNDGWIAFHSADTVDLTLDRDEDVPDGRLHEALSEALSGGGAWFFTALVERARQLLAASAPEEAPGVSSADWAAALWDLVWAGRVSNDTFAPVRGLLGGGRTAHRQRSRPPRVRSPRLGRTGRAGRIGRLRELDGLGPTTTGSPGGPPLGLSPVESSRLAGRWSLLPEPDPDPTVRAHAAAEILLDRYGVITRGTVVVEDLPGGFAAQYRLLTRMEEAGQVRRGYFVEHLGAAQFSTGATVDRLRGFARPDDGDSPTTATPAWRPAAGRPAVAALALAATDPANPYGASLPWPDLPVDADGVRPTGHRPGRKAGAIIVQVDGRLVLYVERGGRTLLSFLEDPTDEQVLDPIATALAWALRTARVERMALEKVNGRPLLGTPLAEALLRAGFYSSPSGVRFRT